MAFSWFHLETFPKPQDLLSGRLCLREGPFPSARHWPCETMLQLGRIRVPSGNHISEESHTSTKDIVWPHPYWSILDRRGHLLTLLAEMVRAAHSLVIRGCFVWAIRWLFLFHLLNECRRWSWFFNEDSFCSDVFNWWKMRDMWLIESFVLSF